MGNYEQMNFEIQNDLDFEFEEYISDLAEEYIENGDYRKTKLFREIENAHKSFPNSQLIAESYTNCLVYLDENQSVDKWISACKRMHKIFEHFSENETIAENCVFLFTLCADELDTKGCKEVLDRAESISLQFPNDGMIKEYCEEIQRAYQRLLECDRLSEYIQELERQLEDNPEDLSLIREYVSGLVKYGEYIDEEECSEIRKKVQKYCIRYEDEKVFKECYAKIIVLLMDRVDENKVGRLLTEVKSLYEENSGVEFAGIYGDALGIVAGLQNSKYKMVMKELKKLLDCYPENPKIIEALACGLDVAIDGEDKKAATKALLELMELAEKYPDNTEVSVYLNNAKLFYSMEYDERFWENTESKDINKNCFAVLDTETTWDNRVMSIGIVIADRETYQPECFRYYIIAPEYQAGGMYSNVLFLNNEEITKTCSRQQAMQDIIDCFDMYGVEKIFAYNASFDKGKLTELEKYEWHDIMWIAANRCYNKCIPNNAECHSNGRLKRGYGVEPILRMLSGKQDYSEVHNALFDAADELKILQYLGYTLDSYLPDSEKSANSKCVSVIDRKEKEIKTGDRICHMKYGKGLVVDCEDEIAEQFGGYAAMVCFVEGDTREIVVPYKKISWKEI